MEWQPTFALYCVDVKTGIKQKVWIDNPILQSVNEEKAMFERNIAPEVATFVIEDSDEMSSEPYKKNPFDSTLQKERYSFYTIDVGEKDRYLPLRVVSDSHSEEKSWVNRQIDSISIKMYRQCIQDGTTKFKVVGSLPHRGFVNVLFDRDHCSEMSWIRSSIEKIGDTFDPAKLSSLSFSPDRNSIYKGGLYTSHVRRLSEYCETMFGVNRYEVAKCFAKRDLYSIDLTGDLSERAYNTSIIAAIHAENGDYEQALKYYRASVDMLEGKNWQDNFRRKMDNFIDYCKKNGTSILSSNF